MYSLIFENYLMYISYIPHNTNFQRPEDVHTPGSIASVKGYGSIQKITALKNFYEG